MEVQKIENYIMSELTWNDQNVALDFVAYLREWNLTFIKDNGYWKDKIYYLVKYKDSCVCFIAIKDPDEPENRWTVWSDNMSSDILAEYSIGDDIKKIAWEHVDLCGNCGSCGGGSRKNIFGRDFERVCGCTFRFDNPGENELCFMKTMVEIRMHELRQKEEL